MQPPIFRLDPDIYSEEIRKMIHSSLQGSIKGSFSHHSEYPVYMTKRSYGTADLPENLPLSIPHIPDVVLSWAGITDKTINEEELLILDLETTGLRRGGGMIAFLIGIGYYENGRFTVEQYFLPQPESECNAFDLILPHLQNKSVLVTFNGKTFDLPVLESRFAHNQLWIDLRNHYHIDVLHLARRLWKKKVPSCALETLEYYVMGHIRDEELDIKGSIIPQTYFHFLISGETELLKRIFLHNATDVLHTAALFSLICEQIDYPLPDERDIRLDYHAIGKLYQSQHRSEEALHILSSMAHESLVSPELLHDLGLMHKKNKDWEQAEHYFHQATDLLYLPSMLELSIMLEQKHKDYESALLVCHALYHRLKADALQNVQKLAAMEKRMDRLQIKIDKQQAKLNAPPKVRKPRKQKTKEQ